jgi:hypothetical protein
MLPLSILPFRFFGPVRRSSDFKLVKMSLLQGDIEVGVFSLRWSRTSATADGKKQVSYESFF